MRPFITIVLLFFVNVLFAQTGVPDSLFGNNGFTILNLNSISESGNKLAFQNEEKIVVSATSYNINNCDFSLTRLLGNGSIDSTFGINGKVITDIGSNEDYVFGIKIQNDQKIIVCGSTGDMSDRDFVLVRYCENGLLDGTFGNNGIVITNQYFDDMFWSVDLQQDEKIVAGGISDGKVCLVRYNSDGSVDNTFGSNGIVFSAIGIYCGAYSISIQNDGKILAAGQVMDITANGLILRYNSDGTPDLSFGDDGYSIIDFGANEYFTSVISQTDGKIVIGGAIGREGSVPTLNFMILRLLANGELDSDFNNLGRAEMVFGGMSICKDIVQDSNKRLVPVGFTLISQNRNIAIGRLLENGMPDTTFGTSGKTIVDLGSDNDAAQGVICNNSNIIVSGQYGDNYNPMICSVISAVSTSTNGIPFEIGSYPNPFNDYLTIEAIKESEKISGIYFYNIMGHQLDVQEELFTTINKGYQISNLGSLPKGPLLLIITTPQHKYISKLIKL